MSRASRWALRAGLAAASVVAAEVADIHPLCAKGATVQANFQGSGNFQPARVDKVSEKAMSSYFICNLNN